MSNFIIEFKNALSSEQCDQLIQKFEAFPKKQPGRTGAGVDKSKKDSLDCHISSQPEWQQECQQLTQLLSKATVAYIRQFPFLITGAISPSIQDPKTKQLRTITHQDIPNLNDQQIENMSNAIFRCDGINLQRYTKGSGGYHHWHSEHYPHPTDQTQKSLHRVLLWLIYLNDVEEGGETEFFYQQASVKPTKGSLILAPVNFTHTHRGCVPISNDKYVLASWINYKTAQEMYVQPKT
ncbi:MAG: 2OG-Fe(II) oxygenase [Kangiellaceae bacterium]|jgi:2-oxoglutarate-Fe(II)-dependent oxygenase superfamily protein